MKRSRGQLAGGFTLLEALLAAVILAFGITAVTTPFAAAARNDLVDVQRTTAVNLAQQLMEKILTLPFNDDDPDYAQNPGPDPSESNQDSFDNIDDYNGYANNARSYFVKHDGVIVQNQHNNDSAVAGLSRHVDAQYVHISGQDTGQTPTFIRVTVEIQYQQQPIVTLTRLVYNVDRF